jgi:hypothetical protein
MTTAAPPPDRSSGPLVICGMHRSGTSLTASLFGGAGVKLGDRLLGPNVTNALGHFEDVGFLEFHMRALHSLGFNYEGYVTRPLPRLAAEFTREAEEIITDRSAGGELWGWKEPRTTLFLDFWDELLPDARYAFVFRNPWDVADSLFRRGDAAFIVDPRLAIEIWVAYNRRIVEFVTRHPTRCVVFEISRLIAEPNHVFELVRSKLQVPLDSPPEYFRNDLFGRECNRHGAAVVRALMPEAHDVYRLLRHVAGEPTAEEAEPAADAASLAGYAVEEWARASRAAVRERKLHGEVAAAQARDVEHAHAVAALMAERDEAVRQMGTAVEQRDRDAERIDTVTGEKKRLESELREFRMRHEQIAEELAAWQSPGLLTRLSRSIEEFFARGRTPPRPRLAPPLDAEAAEHRRAA